MFLVTSGAALHGHEYSRDHFENNSIPKRHPLTRSAFSTPVSQRTTTYEPYKSRAVERPQRALSAYIPRTHETIVRFQEPEADRMSEDGRSVANSEGSVKTAGGKGRRKRSLRPSTAFHLAHPPPTLTQRQRLLQIRPKLLFQLQRTSADSRPKPAIDVLPSTLVVPRLVKKFPRMFKGKGELGANDVMIVKSEDYDAPDDHESEENDSDEEGLANRDLIAVICQLRRESGGSEGKAEIVLNEGRWVASPLPNNVFDFVSVDENGNKTTARWAKAKKSSARKSLDLSEGVGDEEVKFTFSILDPNSRRHPIIATLTQAKLNIPDSYTISSSASKYPPMSPIRGLPAEHDQPSDNDSTPERTSHVVDETLKTLIQVTAVWVALRQGWCSYFRYNDSMMTTPNNSGRGRSMSLTPDGLRPGGLATGASTPESISGGLGAIGSKIRQCNNGCNNRGSPASGTSSQLENSGIPQRSVSTGTAFMKRTAAARRAGLAPISTVASESEGESNYNQPRRAATEVSLSSGSQLSTPPPPLRLPSSSTTTQDTPTKPHRRIQSAYIPTSTLQNSYANGHVVRNSFDAIEQKQIAQDSVKARASRWKTFSNFFRRGHNTRTE